jgi:hypothetical protein
MKLEGNKFSLNELLALRQWFAMWESSMLLKMEFVNQAREAITFIDKTLWSNLVSNKTPWGTVAETEFKDENFEETVQSLFGKNEG